jgi:hypothetical protein
VTSAVVLTATVLHKVTGEPPPSVSVKVTVPVGFVDPANGAIAGVMVVVKVTPWLTVVAAGAATTADVVAVVFTIWVADEKLVPKFASPE